ncbi:MAG: hypothetical protein NUV50_02305 [Rhodospirillales bacterium]|nr:hypothetical protein [Rhodospirillales bacterium]
MKRTIGLALFVAVGLSGCAQQNSMPLVFGSTQTMGLSFTSSATQNQGVDVTIGFKNIDFALVPTTTVDTNNNPVAIRGCYSVGVNVNAVRDCNDNAMAGTVNRNVAVEGASVVGSKQFSGARTESVDVVEVPPLPFTPDILSVPTAVPLPLPSPPVIPINASENSGDKAGPVPNVSTVPNADPKGTNAAAQSMRDSLSVYSSFDGKTNITSNQTGADVGMTLGKAFATGVAAQQLTEAMNYYLQYKGQALVFGAKETAKADCVRALTDALGAGNVTAEALKTCGG